MSLAILILAAGASSRMKGRDKLLEEVQGEPLLRRIAKRALHACPLVLVALPTPPAHGMRRSVLEGLDVNMVDVPAPDLGMSHSLMTGVAALPEGCTGVVILPADMPDVTSKDLAVICAAAGQSPEKIIRATSADGQPGHPVVFPRVMFDDLKSLSGDQGARAVVQRHSAHIQLVELPKDHAITDLDTPDAWSDWRARQVQN